MICREELAFRIGPAILFSTDDQERPRGDEGEKLVLIDRKLGFVIVVAFEILAEPVRESRVDVTQRFTVAPARQRRSAAAGFFPCILSLPCYLSA